MRFAAPESVYVSALCKLRPKHSRGGRLFIDAKLVERSTSLVEQVNLLQQL